ncbi:beta strand repeat-containing protein [Halocalculus aciditolerans]|uniref:Uncharacterized protein n=1 Tax=Halocalculus aciditolerans TaxID=1383812 RepID=A0A830F289_9EURY|nr:hypothetical protein [Halocalculus aciditolerans]GGL48185.1 hypothetical protein GCM10009039_03020 [Halocalculus aciditolerans]
MSSTARLNAVLVAALVLVSVVAGTVVFTGAVAAASGANISVSPNGSGQVANTEIRVSPDQSSSGQKGNSLSKVYVDYSTGSNPPADASDVGLSDVTAAYVVNKTSGDYVTDLTDDLDGVSHGQQGHKISFSFNNSRTLVGDEVYVIEYGGVTNPEAGDHAVTVGFNSNTGATASYTTVDATPPAVSVDASANGADGQRVDVNVTSDEALSALTTDVTGSGSTDTTLSLGDFTNTSSNGDYTYNYTGAASGLDGEYTATVTDAADTADPANHIDDSPSDSVTVNTVPVSVDGGATTNASVSAGETVVQSVTVNVSDYSAYGGDDTLYVDFADGVDVSVRDVSADVGVADYGANGNNVSLRVATGSGGGTTDVSATVNVSATYDAATEDSHRPVAATAVDSDGGRDADANVTFASVADSPFDVTNFSLHQVDGTQRVNVTFNATEPLDTSQLSLRGDATTTLDPDYEMTEHGPDDYAYTGEVHAGEDGRFTATLDSATDTDGDALYADGESTHEDAATVNEIGIDVVDASVTNRTVSEDSTANHDVTVNVEGVSLDGQADHVEVTFPDALSVSAASASSPTADASVSGTTLEDADGDGSKRTVAFDVATGDGGGTTSVSVTVDADLAYPDGTEGERYPVDATAVDSDGDSDSETNLTYTRVRDTVPEIANYTVSADGQDVDVSFDASKQLASATVELGGDASGTLSIGSGLTESANRDGTYRYTGNVSEGQDGTFWANLTSAADDDGDQTDTYAANASVNAVAIDVVGGSVSNASVHPATTVSETVSVDVTGASRDGERETVTLTLPDAMDGNVTGVRATTDGATVTGWSPQDDSADSAARATVATGDGGGTAAFSLAVDVETTYPESTEGETLAFTASGTDSDGDSDTGQSVATVTVVEETPKITNFTLVADGQDADLAVNATEPLSTLDVSLSGDATTSSLSRSDFEAVNASSHSYRADVSTGADGTFEASLAAEDAADDEGQHVASDHSDSRRVSTTRVAVVDAAVNRTNVSAETAVGETVTVEVADYSRDGGTDSLAVTFPANASVSNPSASVTAGAGSVTDATANAHSVTVSLDTGSARGTTDVTVDVAAKLDIPDAEGRDLVVNATAADSDGDSDAQTNLTRIHVTDTVPEITNYTVSADGQDVDVSFDASKQLASATVALGGDTSGTLSIGSGLTETANGDGTYRYTGNVSGGRDGAFWANLTSATDDDGDATDTYAANASVNAVGIDIVGGAITPETVDADATATQVVTVNATGVSRDGEADALAVTLPNATTQLRVVNASVSAVANTTTGVNATTDATDVNATTDATNADAVAASLAGNVSVIDGDDDGHATTAVVPVSVGDGGGAADVSVTVAVTTHYPERAGGARLPVTASAADSDGDTDSAGDLADVSVVAASTPDTGGGATYVSDPEPPEKEMRISVLRPTSTNTTVFVANYQNGTTVDVPVPGMKHRNETAVEPSNVRLSAANASDVGVVFRPNATAAGSDPLTTDGVAPVGYFAVNTTPDAAFDDADVSFSVDTGYFWNPTPATTTLYAYDDGTWTPTNATTSAVENGTFTYTTHTTGNETYAVGVARANVALRNATLATDAVAAGENATVTAVVENTGDTRGVYWLDVTLNGTEHTRRSVAVAADTTEQVTLAFDPPGGTHAVAVNGRAVGNLSAAPDADETTTTRNETTAQNQTTTDAPTTTANQTAPGEPTTAQNQSTTTRSGTTVDETIDAASDLVSDAVDAVTDTLDDLF